MDKDGAVLASDGMGIGPDGSSETCEAYLADIKSGASKLTSFEFGPMEVKVIGSVAIVQGTARRRAWAIAKTPAASMPGCICQARRKEAGRSLANRDR